MNCNPKLCSPDEKQRAGDCCRNGWRHERKDKERRRVTREGLQIESRGATEEGRKNEEEDSLVSWLGCEGVEDEGMQAAGEPT